LNQAYLVTGLVEEHFATVTMTVTQLRHLSSPEWNDEDASLEHSSRNLHLVLEVALRFAGGTADEETTGVR
jgi:hypothetical protein